ncbi:nucleoside-diphosphate sugar epimerase/dehydratase [Desulfovibrio psychrotolerans]|uniref:Nucleoside-diphosphate sugar epimerase n=1 Tax=Desulfovibrio psychrotolerans TaxID=415242 RepID=A0A7J0BSA3_9BACT|nr:nucleoside-diphosphate sugar epimerase/dehydratase [Desulfovibrio psychrotolerans]GFM36587.1 nucleoside-diphosphate sugar epimerase [Desulfovibrio psychrotolerans]
MTLFNFRSLNFYIMVGIDLLCFAAALFFSYCIRFDFNIPHQYLVQYMNLLIPTLLIKFSVFLALGMYRGMWRYTSLHDTWKLLQGIVLQTGMLLIFIFYMYGTPGFARAVFILDPFATFILTGGVRLAIRMAFSLRENGTLPFCGPRCLLSKDERKRVLIIGAGRAGEQFARELQSAPHLGYEVVGFIDREPELKGRTIHGKTVFGGLDLLASTAQLTRAHEAIIALTEASGDSIREIVSACKSTELAHKILPPMNEILDWKRGIKALREVNYLDLLGRTQVELDTQAIAAYLEGRTILVTGCGGSIGSELVRQIVRFHPAKLVLVDSGEHNLYQIEMELLHRIGFKSYVTVLGNIRDKALMQSVFAVNQPHAVFHAAAYKHVPMLERNPWQAVHNNVFGTRTLMQAAVDAGVERFVVVSTDKAVRPTNVMGATKRITEMLMQSFSGGATRFMAVRFGNVLGSSGSVIPLFLDQISKGGPVTVTHPEVTRYFMSIPEAAQLILQSGTMAQGGEIFVLDMGVPVRIADMAADLIRLAGLEPGKDIDIIFTGLREGEKLYEELITDGEGILRTEHDKIMVLGCCDSPVSAPHERKAFYGALEELDKAAAAYDPVTIRTILRRIVPEYIPADELRRGKAD